MCKFTSVTNGVKNHVLAFINNGVSFSEMLGKMGRKLVNKVASFFWFEVDRYKRSYQSTCCLILKTYLTLPHCSQLTLKGVKIFYICNFTLLATNNVYQVISRLSLKNIFSHIFQTLRTILLL